MTKKSIDKKSVIAQVKSLRLSGITDQEIYAQLAPEYFDRKTLATLITATVTEERKRKYQDAQITLLVVLGLTVILKLLTAVSLIIAEQKAVALVFVVLLPAVNVYFFIQIFKYEASIYRSCGLFAVLGISRIMNGMASEAGWLIIADIVIIGLIAGLSFYLDSKLFPNYSPRNMNADANGNYVVE
jgi:hypothetical protein